MKVELCGWRDSREGSKRGYLNENGEIVYKSKNLQAERNRRSRLNESLYCLRSLVPKITKMNKSTIIDDAVNYIKELQNQERELRDQLTDSSLGEEQKKNEMSLGDEASVMGEVEVRVMGRNRFYIKMIHENRRDGLVKMMETMKDLGFEISNINTTASMGLLHSILCVEAMEAKMIPPDQVRDLLLDMIKGKPVNDKPSFLF